MVKRWMAQLVWSQGCLSRSRTPDFAGRVDLPVTPREDNVGWNHGGNWIASICSDYPTEDTDVAPFAGFCQHFLFNENANAKACARLHSMCTEMLEPTRTGKPTECVSRRSGRRTRQKLLPARGPASCGERLAERNDLQHCTAVCPAPCLHCEKTIPISQNTHNCCMVLRRSACARTPGACRRRMPCRRGQEELWATGIRASSTAA